MPNQPLMKKSLNLAQITRNPLTKDFTIEVDEYSNPSFGNNLDQGVSIGRLSQKRMPLKEDDQNKQRFIKFLENQLQLKNKEIQRYEE